MTERQRDLLVRTTLALVAQARAMSAHGHRFEPHAGAAEALSWVADLFPGRFARTDWLVENWARVSELDQLILAVFTLLNGAPGWLAELPTTHSQRWLIDEVNRTLGLARMSLEVGGGLAAHRGRAGAGVRDHGR